MRRFKKSILAWCALIHTVVFFALYFLLPENIFKYVGYALVLGSSAAALWRWRKDAFYNFREGRTGANFLVVGTYALIFGLFAHRVVVVGSDNFPNLWLFQDDVLIRGAVWYLAGALTLLLFAPDIEEGRAPPNSFFTLMGGIAIGSFLTGFSLAMGISSIALPKADTDLPVCPETRPVIGSSNNVYHTLESKYRDMVVPRRCFKDTDEAKRNGFRPPN